MGYTPPHQNDHKKSVRVASTGNVSLASPGSTIDGITMAVGDRVLLKDQSTASENGLYEWEGASTSMRRAPDANQAGELTAGLQVTVEEGTANADTTWVLTTDGAITIDTTALSFELAGTGEFLPLEGGTLTGNLVMDSGTTVTSDNAEIGAWPNNTAFAQFSHSSFFDVALSYSVLQNGSTGKTYINSASGQTTSFLINASTVATLGTGGFNLLSGNVDIDDGNILLNRATEARIAIQSDATSAGGSRSYIDMTDGNDDGWRIRNAADGGGNPIDFTPYTAASLGTTSMSLDNSGNLSLPITGSSAGLSIGSDWQVFWATTNEARLAANNRLVLSDGTGFFGRLTSTAIDSQQLLRVYDTAGTPGTIFAIFETGRMEWGAPASGVRDVALARGGADYLELDSGDQIRVQQDPSDGNDLARKTYVDNQVAGVSGAPTGSVTDFAGSSAPTGWLICDGSAVSRTTYSDLFAVIGTTYGAGDGSTTFNLPDAQGAVIVGLDSAQTEFDALGETGGAKTHTLSTSEMPAHDHTGSSGSSGATANSNGSHNHNSFSATGERYRRGFSLGSGQSAHAPTGGGTAYNPSTTTNGAHTHTVSNHTHTISSEGGGGAHNNLQPYIVMHKIIKT